EVNVGCGAEAPDQAVEQLHDVGTRLDLRLEIRNDHHRQALHQLVPRRRLAIHESLGRGEVPRWTAFDEIAGEGEWRAREADDSRASAELTLHLADRLQREGHLGRVERPQRGDVGGRADRPVDDRPDLGLDPHADTHRLEGQHDVGEEDGRVDAQFADRYQRDLGAKVWVLCEFEDPVVLPQFYEGGE